MRTSIRLTLWGFISLAAAGNLRAAVSNHCDQNFDSLPTNVREYVVHSITDCVRTTSIVLTRDWRPAETNLFLVRKWEMESEPIFLGLHNALGLRRCQCVEILKGNLSVGRNEVCYLYDVRRMYCPPVVMFPEGNGGPFDLEPEEFAYYNENDRKMKKGKGKLERWKLRPPYDPYSYNRCIPDAVSLMFLTPEHQLLMDRMGSRDYNLGCHMNPFYWTRKATFHKIADAKKMRREELMKTLGVEAAFSNRVFSLNEGCTFHVDYYPPRLEWKPEELVHHKPQPKMLLSSEEVSEVVRLAYAVDGDAAGYDAACARCPQLLKPVTEFRTGIGRMLREALSAGGMLPNGAPPAAKE